MKVNDETDESERKQTEEEMSQMPSKLNVKTSKGTENVMLKEQIKSSLFTDIKELLKALESTKKQIEAETIVRLEERDPKILYALSSALEENQMLRTMKLVDGCISAISNDVKVFAILSNFALLKLKFLK